MRSFKTLYQNCQKLQKQHSHCDYCMLMFFFFNAGQPHSSAKHYKITVSLRELKSYWTFTIGPIWKTQPNPVFMQPTDKLQKKTAARTSLELTLLSDTRTYSTLYNNAVHMHSQEIRRLLFTEDIERQAQWEMRHNSFLFSHIHLH